MTLPSVDWQGKPYPLKSILMLNEDVHNALISVVKDLTPEQLNFSRPEIPNRTIAQMINHILDAQHRFFLKELIFKEKEAEPKFEPAKNINELLQRIEKYYQNIVNLYQKINPADFGKVIETSWGQKLSIELAAFQGITHTYYHVSEICFMCGLGGFYNKALG